MAHKKVNIPVIAITPEAEEDDDHNYRTLADVLTDVETLEFENESRIRHSIDKGRHKLIIKLGDENGAVTDTEDVEGSGEEMESKIVVHEKPISIDNIDLDPGTCKETHKVKSRIGKGKKKLHTQSSTVTEANTRIDLDSLYAHDGTTDVEYYSASEDDTPIKYDKEFKGLDQIIDVDFSTKILDKIAQMKSSPAITPCGSDIDESKSKKLTDIENLDSDSENRSSLFQSKKIRRRRQKPKYEAYDTDEENFEFRSYKNITISGDKKESEDSNASSSNEGTRYDIKFKKSLLKVKNIDSNKSDNHTDVEALDSSDDQGVIDIPVAIVKRCKKGHSTEEENLSDAEISYQIETVPEMSIPKPFRKLVTVKETNSVRPIVTITPIADEYVPGLRQSYYDATDEESFSDTEALLFAEALSRCATPDLSIFEGGFDDISENIKLRRKSLRAASPSLKEVLTDTEDLYLGIVKNKRHPPKYLSTLTVSRPKRHSLTDTEDLVFSDHDKDTRRRTISDEGTDLESLIMSDEEYLNEKVDLLRALSATPIYMREMGGDTILSKEGSGPFSDNNRLKINRRVSIVRSTATSPIITDTEEVYASDADDELMPRAGAPTPIDLRKKLDDSVSSKIHSQHTQKIDLESPHEVMYLKGGSYREVHTDVEDVNVSDDDHHTCGNKKKFSVDILSDNNVLVSMKKTCANLKDCPGSYGFKNGKGTIKKIDASDNLELSRVEPLNAKIFTTEFVFNISAECSKYVTVLYWEIPFNATVPYTEELFYLVGNTILVHDQPMSKNEVSKLSDFSRNRTGFVAKLMEKFERRRRYSVLAHHTNDDGLYGEYRLKEWDATKGKPSADGTVYVKGKPAVDAEKDVGEEGDSEVPSQGPSSHSSQRFVADQHQLSEEMKQLLRDMEEDSKK